MSRGTLSVEEFKAKARRLVAALDKEEKDGQSETGLVHLSVRGEIKRLDAKIGVNQASLDVMKNRVSPQHIS